MTRHSLVKLLNEKEKEQIGGLSRKKEHVTYKEKKIRVITGFFNRVLYPRRKWISTLNIYKEIKCEARILYSVRPASEIKGTNCCQQELKEHYSSEPFLRNLQENELHTIKMTRETSK